MLNLKKKHENVGKNMPKLQNKHNILGKNMLKSHSSTEKQHKKRKHL